MYGPKVVRRLRPAASVGEFTQPSVTKTASGGVLAATHSAASRSADESTWLVEVAVQAATSSGDGMLRARAAASAGAGQRRMSQAAAIATAIHIAWNSLFMSKSMTLTWTTFGIANRPMIHAARNARCGSPRARSEAIAS